MKTAFFLIAFLGLYARTFCQINDTVNNIGSKCNQETTNTMVPKLIDYVFDTDSISISGTLMANCCGGKYLKRTVSNDTIYLSSIDSGLCKCLCEFNFSTVLKGCRLNSYKLVLNNQFIQEIKRKNLISQCIDTSLRCITCNCYALYKPVMGCDGNVYSNDCVAKNFGVLSYKTIETKIDSVIKIDPKITTCIDSSRICNSCICTKEYFPVLGCDGEIYANTCFAKKNGVTMYKRIGLNKEPIDSTFIVFPSDSALIPRVITYSIDHSCLNPVSLPIVADNEINAKMINGIIYVSGYYQSNCCSQKMADVIPGQNSSLNIYETGDIYCKCLQVFCFDLQIDLQMYSMSEYTLNVTIPGNISKTFTFSYNPIPVDSGNTGTFHSGSHNIRVTNTLPAIISNITLSSDLKSMTIKFNKPISSADIKLMPISIIIDNTLIKSLNTVTIDQLTIDPSDNTKLICTFTQTIPENSVLSLSFNESGITFKDDLNNISNVTNKSEIYPNPANNTLTVNCYSDFTSLEIFDMSGKRVLMLVNKKQTKSTIDISLLTAGHYNIICKFNDKKVFTGGFVKN